MNMINFTVAATLSTTPDFARNSIKADIKSDDPAVEERISTDGQFAIEMGLSVLAATMAALIQHGASNGMDTMEGLQKLATEKIARFVDMETRTMWMKRSKPTP